MNGATVMPVRRVTCFYIASFQITSINNHYSLSLRRVVLSHASHAIVAHYLASDSLKRRKRGI